MNKYREHQKLINIMELMNSNMMWKIYSTLSSSSYLIVLK